MLLSIWQKIDQPARSAFPLLTCFIFLVMEILPWPLPRFGNVSPLLVFIALYHWSIYRPDFFRAGSAFATGLFLDALSDLPLGLSAFLFVAVQQLASTRRRYFVGHAFPMFWFGFGLLLSLFLFFEWLALGLWNKQFAPLGPVIVQDILTVAVFPLFAWLLIAAQRRIMPQSER
jgi:rod shape-determining protein MreD